MANKLHISIFWIRIAELKMLCFLRINQRIHLLQFSEDEPMKGLSFITFSLIINYNIFPRFSNVSKQYNKTDKRVDFYHSTQKRFELWQILLHILHPHYFSHRPAANLPISILSKHKIRTSPQTSNYHTLTQASAAASSIAALKIHQPQPPHSQRSFSLL